MNNGYALSCRSVVLAGVVLGWLALVPGCATPPRAAAAPQMDAQQREANVASFDYVWQTIRDKHFDPQLGGLDWDAIRDELRPRVLEARSVAEARAVMSDLIDRLGQSHFAIIPTEVYRALDVDTPPDSGVESKAGVIGVEVRVIDGQALIAQVRPDSPAAQAGVRPGWQIVRVAGEEVAPVLARIREVYRDSTLSDFFLSNAVSTRLRGPVGEPVAVEFRDERGQAVELSINRCVPPGARAQLGHLPVMYAWLESRRVEPDIGYIALNMFFDPPSLMSQFEQALESFRDTAGVIIDLRGNPGGIGAMAMGMAGWLVGESGSKLGTMHLRSGEVHFAVFPRARPYGGPVAVLIDGCSGSTAEIFAAGLRDLGRARLFGTRSMGAALPSAIERLPNGDGFQYAIADYLSVGGGRLEGNGVAPDAEVPLTREALLAGRDPVIEAACRWIHEQQAARAQPPPATPAPPEPAVAVEPPAPAETASSAAETVSAEAILSRMIEALGGEAALGQLHSRVTRGRFAAGRQEVTGRFAIYQVAPNKSYRLVEIDNGSRSEAGTDGEVYWDISPVLGPRVLSGEEKAMAQREMRFNDLLHWRELFTRAECLEVQPEGPQPYYKLRMTPALGSPEIWYVDYNTHLLTRKETTLRNPFGVAPTEFTLADYRPVDGVLIPHTITQVTFGVIKTVVVENVEHNVEIPESRFVPPPAIQELLQSGEVPR